VGNNFQFNLLTAGYLEVKKIEPMLVLWLRVFRTASFDDFNKGFQRAFLRYGPSQKIKPQWHTFAEVAELQSKPKTIVNPEPAFVILAELCQKATLPM